MKSRVKEIFDNINSLDDLQKWVSESADGESLWLEFKGIQKEKKDWGLGAFEKHIRTLVAKVVCAFLNTCDGIICVGVNYNSKKRLVKMNEYEGDLYKYLEGAMVGLFEPDPAGFGLKSIEDGVILIFVPKSEMCPHRVCGNVEKDVARNYYIRSDASSKSLPESVVRSLYLSHGRTPSIEMFTNVEVVSSDLLFLNVFAKPDEVVFIDRYYDYERFFMLDGGGERIEYEDDGGLWTSIDPVGSRLSKPIYPTNNLIKMGTHSITNNASSDSGDFPDGLTEDSDYNPLCDDTRIPAQDFQSLKYIITESGFACDGISLKKDKRLFVLPDWLGKKFEGIYRNKKCEFYRSEKFKKLEEKYDLKVFVADYYGDDDILGYFENESTIVIPGNGQISVGQIDSFIEKILVMNE